MKLCQLREADEFKNQSLETAQQKWEATVKRTNAIVHEIEHLDTKLQKYLPALLTKKHFTSSKEEAEGCRGLMSGYPGLTGVFIVRGPEPLMPRYARARRQLLRNLRAYSPHAFLFDESKLNASDKETIRRLMTRACLLQDMYKKAYSAEKRYAVAAKKEAGTYVSKADQEQYAKDLQKELSTAILKQAGPDYRTLIGSHPSLKKDGTIRFYIQVVHNGSTGRLDPVIVHALKIQMPETRELIKTWLVTNGLKGQVRLSFKNMSTGTFTFGIYVDKNDLVAYFKNKTV